MSAATDGGAQAPLGTLEAVAELYAEHAAHVRRLVGGSVQAPGPVIEDACQIAWSRLIRDRARVRRGTAVGWLVRTASREVFKLLRRSGREVSLEALGDERCGASPIGTPALMDELLDDRARLEAIRVLPERQQRLVWLQVIGLSYDEMASRTGDSRRTVERQLLRAKRKLERSAA